MASEKVTVDSITTHTLGIRSDSGHKTNKYENTIQYNISYTTIN